jgi:hypothetical protein
MISINRKKKKREEIWIFERANREREGRKKKKRKEGKIKEKGKELEEINLKVRLCTNVCTLSLNFCFDKF